MTFFKKLFNLPNPEIKKMKEEGNISDLIKLMSSNKRLRIRKDAAKALVDLYKSGNLTKKQKKEILALRGAIASSHTDRAAKLHRDKPVKGHEDRSWGSKLDTGCAGEYHVDRGVQRHEDVPGRNHQDVVKKGLGINFPL
ncbi:MAG: hypothetical protein AMJ43_09505 [Coxiella sp. DG_40]|nr:MAG: hypothetical protein AMJ43_09505 [Coxiella sp. DG_40]